MLLYPAALNSQVFSMQRDFTRPDVLQIAPMAAGRIDIQYRRVDCTPPNPVSIDIDNNVGSGGWLRLVVEVSTDIPSFSSSLITKIGRTHFSKAERHALAIRTSGNRTLPWSKPKAPCIRELNIANREMQKPHCTSHPFCLAWQLGQRLIIICRNPCRKLLDLEALLPCPSVELELPGHQWSINLAPLGKLPQPHHCHGIFNLLLTVARV